MRHRFRSPSRLLSLGLLPGLLSALLGAGCHTGVGPDEEAAVEEARGAATPLTGAPGELDALVARLAQSEVVLIGEATHGTEEFYRLRAEISQRLIAEHGFAGVVIEGDWPHARRVDRAVRGGAQDPDPLGGFTRFPTWMWRNTAVRDFVDWLRTHNAGEGEDAGFYGMDVYSLNESFDALLAYLDRVDPAAASQARQARGCFREEELAAPELYGQRVSRSPRESCFDELTAQLDALLGRENTYAPEGDAAARDAYFDALQNARVVRSAERYFRSAFTNGNTASWNLRDSHMAETLDALREHLGRDGAPAKLVVWAHNSHVNDASATERATVKEHTLGQLMRERLGGGAFLLGQTTYTGTVIAAEEWGQSPRRRDVNEALEESYEGVFHATGLDRFLLVLRGGNWSALAQPRLYRAIGVVYVPETERQSHYFSIDLPNTFDAVIHVDVTRGVEPLDPL
jgi:erythromycin esterase-like protein